MSAFIPRARQLSIVNCQRIILCFDGSRPAVGMKIPDKMLKASELGDRLGIEVHFAHTV